MIVLDLFAGTGSSTAAFEQNHKVIRVELDRQHQAELHQDDTTLTVEQVIAVCGGRPDFIWASPPCQAFSVAAIGRYWSEGGSDPKPKHPKAIEAQRVVRATLDLIHALRPAFWLLENPRGMLRKLLMMGYYERRTVTYCRYGDERQKPTDLWGVMPDSWIPRPTCRAKMSCHQAAPRGSKTGTQGRVDAVERSRVPFELSREICEHVERALSRT